MAKPINPKNMNEQEANILNQVIDQITEPNVYFEPILDKQLNTIGFSAKKSANEKDGVVLTHQIVKSGEDYFHIVGKKVGSGSQAILYEADTLIRRNKQLIYKNDPQHQRLIKRLKCDRKRNLDSQLKDTSTLYAAFPHLHAKVTKHECLEKVRETFQQATYVDVVMHRVPGKPLSNILQHDTHQLTPALQFELSRKILEALEAQIHAKGYVHNDIKPENMMVDIDFKAGIVRSVTFIDVDLAMPIDSARVDLSTVAYLAPEFMNDFSGGCKQTIQSDLYSTAIVLAQVWGAHPDRVERRNGFENSFNFKPDFTLPDDGLGTNASVQKLLEKMGNNNPKERETSIYWVKQLESLEQQSFARVRKASATSAMQQGSATKTTLLQLSQGDNMSSQPAAQRLDRLVRTVSNQMKSHTAETALFMRMLDVNMLRGCANNQAACIALETLQQDFAENQKKIDCIKGTLEAKQMRSAKDEDDLNAVLRLIKKINKCKALDDFYACNAHITNKVNALYQPQKEKVKNDQAFITDLINRANRFDNLNIAYDTLMNPAYSNALKNEQVPQRKRGSFISGMFQQNDKSEGQSVWSMLMWDLKKKTELLSERETTSAQMKIFCIELLDKINGALGLRQRKSSISFSFSGQQVMSRQF